MFNALMDFQRLNLRNLVDMNFTDKDIIFLLSTIRLKF